MDSNFRFVYSAGKDQTVCVSDVTRGQDTPPLLLFAEQSPVTKVVELIMLLLFYIFIYLYLYLLLLLDPTI